MIVINHLFQQVILCGNLLLVNVAKLIGQGKLVAKIWLVFLGYQVMA